MPWTFFILAYGISWLLWSPMWLPAFGVLELPSLPLNSWLGGGGPLFAAAILLARGRKGKVLQVFANKAFWLGHGWYWLLAIAIPSLYLIFLICLGSGALLLEPEFLRLIPLHFLFFGLGEEMGWRGYALPHLQRKYDSLNSAILLAIAWALWHIPLWLAGHGPTPLETPRIMGWLLTLIAGSVVLTWLFNSSRGSVLTCVFFHTMFNTVSMTPMAGFLAVSIIGLSIWIVYRMRPEHLSQSPRITV